jgi:cytidylate kinase
MIIAIDGPAGAGKSTVARLCAKKLGFIYLDTGAIYRALTLKALNQNIDFQDDERIIQMSKDTQLAIGNNQDGSVKILLDGEDVSRMIREPKVTQFVSVLARIRGVRDEMLTLQRGIGRQSDAVVDGRDIGTVVFPNADKKFYLDANFAERVKRRFKELNEAGSQVSLEEVKSDLRSRDSIDSNREFAPLKKADDAIYIDTTNMSIQEVVSAILKDING